MQAKRKYQEVLAVKQQLDGDNQELQQKYSQKAMYVLHNLCFHCLVTVSIAFA